MEIWSKDNFSFWHIWKVNYLLKDSNVNIYIKIIRISEKLHLNIKCTFKAKISIKPKFIL